MEIRSPCNSSSQTFSIVPAFPSVSTTPLPINSDCAAPYSSKIFDARRFTGGIARPCSAEPSMMSKAAQQRSLSQRMIDGDCSSNSRSRLICALRLPGNSGSSFRNVRSLSAISCTIARLCLESMSMRLRITKPRSGKNAPGLASTPPAALPFASTAGNGTGDRRFWLSARALVFDNSGPCSRNLWLSATCAV